MDKKILDACCGSRMWHFDKSNKEVLFMDNRELNTTLCDGRKLIVSPDIFDYEVPLLLKDAEGKDFKWETLKKFAEKQ
jgi:hypothetical protein